jgi:adenylate kinase
MDMTSNLGKKFLEHSSRGELVPDEVTIGMWKQNIHAQTVLSIYKPAQDLLVLDGIPRSLAQAKALDPYLEVLNVIHLVCRDVDAMVMRMRRRALKENRLDDADEKVIRRRFEVYQRETAPVLGHYPKSVVHEVDAVGSPAVILQRILDIVAPIQDAHFRNPLAGDPKA